MRERQFTFLDQLSTNVLSASWWKQTWHDLKMSWWLLKQPEVPMYAKAVPALLLLYLVTPIDVIPDFIPVLGQMDDLAIALLALRIFLRLVPTDAIERYGRETGDMESAMITRKQLEGQSDA